MFFRAKGQSLLELMIAVAVFALFAAAVATLALNGFSGTQSGQDNSEANFLAQEGLDATRSIRATGWQNVTLGAHGLKNSSGYWEFDSTSQTIGKYTRIVTVSAVNRNGSGDIVTSGGTLDPRTKHVSSAVFWTEGVIARSVTVESYLVDWNVYDWKQTTDTDFNAGTKTQTVVSGTGTAASVQLGSGAAKTWDLDGGEPITQTTDVEFAASAFTSPFTDNSAALFNAGTYTSNTQHDVANQWVELTAAGQIAGTGTFTSRVYSANGYGAWTPMNWLSSRPAGKALPNNKAVESGYSAGNFNMSTNTILYHFDEAAAATSFVDGSGDSNTATCTVCPTSGVVGKFNNTVTFNGTTQFITAPVDLNQWLGATASLSFWIRTTQLGNNTSWSAPGVTGVEAVSTGNDIFWGWLDATGRIGVMAGNTAGAKSLLPINDNVWHHVGLTRSDTNGEVKVYVDGVLQQTATSETGVKTTPFANIGRIDDTGGTPMYLNGSLDEFAIFPNVIFTDAQALDLYRRGAQRLKFQVRSCNDAACAGETFMGPDGTAATYYTEASNTTSGPTTVALTNVPNNGYMQYQATFETDSASYTPELVNITIAGVAVPLATFTNTEITGTGSAASIIETATSGWTTVLQGQSFYHTTDTDFAPGTFASTVLAGTGTGANIRLNTDYDWYAPASPTAQTMLAVHMRSSTDGWAVGNSGTIARWDGTSWNTVTSPTTQNLGAVDCLTSSDCWALGSSGQIIRWNGTTWSNVIDTGNQNFRGIEAVSSTMVWAGANSGQIYRWNGTTWSQTVDLGNHNFRGISCVSSTDCWASADSGRIVRWNGTSWSQFVDTGGEQYNGIDMVSSTDAWIVANGGTIRRWNGTSWNAVTSGTTNDLFGVSCNSAVDCWVVGEAGTILRWNGTSWNAVTSPIGTTLTSIDMYSSSFGASVGNGGVMLNYDLLYFSSGTFSNIVDAGSSVSWGIAQWDRILPANTTLTIATRTGNTAVPDGSWTAFSAESAVNTGMTITSAAGRYLQYRATLSTTNRFATPSLDGIVITYGSSTQNMNAVFMVTATDGWAVGNNGTIMRWNGTAWSSVTSPTTQALNGIDCVSSTDCWAVAGAGQIIRWNGTSWSNFVDTGTHVYRGVKMTSASAGWAVADSGRITRWNGSTWTQFIDLGNHTFTGVDCVSATACGAVSTDGRIVSWNGTTWADLDDTGSHNYGGIDCLTLTDCWAVADSGRIVRWNGSSWNQFDDLGSQTWTSVHLTSATSGWTVGAGGAIALWNGTSWTPVSGPTSNQLNGVFTVSTTDAWAVGASGTVIRYQLSYPASATFISAPIDAGSSTTWNEVSWNMVTPATTSITIATRTGNVSVPDGTWSAWSAEQIDAGGSAIASPAGRYIQYRATFTSGNQSSTASLDDLTVVYGKPTLNDLYGTSGIDVSNVWSVGAGGVIVRYNGTTWATQASPVTDDLRAVSMRTTSDGFAVGDGGVIIRYNGTTWSTVTSPVTTTLNDVSFITASFGAAVGAGGRILHWNGTTWSTVTSPVTSELKSVSMVSATSGWAVGVGGVILRWNGTTWATQASPVVTDLNGINMLSGTAGWAVGTGGIIVRWNGTNWATQTSPVTTRLFGVEARSASEVWAVGASGVLLTYNGTLWSTYYSPTSRALYDVTVYAPTDGWAVGDFGTMLKDPPTYAPNGTFLSSVLDTDSVTAALMTVYWSVTLPANTAVTVAMRSGPTAVPDGSWTAFTSEMSTPTGFAPSLAANRYVQYRATLSTTDTSVTPSFDDITVTYKP